MLPAGTGWSILEVARRHGDFALAGVAATRRARAAAACASARIVLFGVGADAVRARTRAEQLLRGQAAEPRALRERRGAARGADSKSRCPTCTRRREYRRDLARVLTRARAGRGRGARRRERLTSAGGASHGRDATRFA